MLMVLVVGFAVLAHLRPFAAKLVQSMQVLVCPCLCQCSVKPVLAPYVVLAFLCRA